MSREIEEPCPHCDEYTVLWRKRHRSAARAFCNGGRVGMGMDS